MKEKKWIIPLTILLICLNGISISAAPVKGKNDNIAPVIDLNVIPAKKPVDIVLLTDYTGTKRSTLNTQINALKAQFNALNVDPVFHVVTDIKKVGTQIDALHKFRRYGRYHAKVNYYSENDEKTKKNKWFEEKELWEETEGLASQSESLPKRNPKNVTFVRGPLEERETDRSYSSWYDIEISCTNDVKTHGSVRMEKEYYSYTSDRYRDKQNIIDEYAAVDSGWVIEEKISDVTFDIYSFDFDRLNQIPLREGSDRHMVFISDSATKDYSRNLGDYFCFGDMTEAFTAYVQQNNFSLYGVLPVAARDRTLLPDRVIKILRLGTTTLFYLRSGTVVHPLTNYGVTTYPEFTENIGDIREIIETNASVYLHMEDGTVRYYDDEEGEMKALEGIADVSKVYNFRPSNDLYILNNSGKVFLVESDKTVIPFDNSVVVRDIFHIELRNENIYITASGVPYMEYMVYNNNNNTQTRHLLTRAKIMDKQDESIIRNMPNIKAATYFSASAPRNGFISVLLLYKTGQMQQFLDIRYERIENGHKESTIPYLIENPEYSILENDIESIIGNDVCAFIVKSDSSIRMLNVDWTPDEYEDRDGDDHDYMRPSPKNHTISIPLADIQKMVYTGTGRYFFVDSNNNTYMYDGRYNGAEGYGQAPVIGTTIKNLGTKIKKIIVGYKSAFNSNDCIYLLYNDGEVREYECSTISYSSRILNLPNVKDIYPYNRNVYLLDVDGYVYVRSSNTNNYNIFSNYFKSPLEFDTAKKYVSLLDIFNEVSDSKFYPAGAYPTAFSDIYKYHESFSGSGSAYVLMGEEVKYETEYSDYENDPEHSRQWRIAHDPGYFDNSMGVSAYHKPAGFTANPPAVLDKVGKYVINLKARDNPKSDNRFDNYRLWSLGDQNLTVYVHRKPIALASVRITDNGDGTYTARAEDAGSYDLDHNVTRADKGIVDREWRWRRSISTEWVTGRMNKTDCTADEGYIIQLRVKDVEGVWSDYDTITIDESKPPVALFSIDKALISTSESLKVKDMSFPQSFSTITDWHWVVKKLNSDGSVPSGNIQNAKFTNSNTGTGTLAGYDRNVKYSYSSTGTYRIYLRVKDSNGLWSDKAGDSLTPVDLSRYYSMDIQVDTQPAASFDIEKNPIYVEESLQLRDTSTASGISPIIQWHWIVKKLGEDGSVPSGSIQNDMFSDSNTGAGTMAGYDVNVKTDYEDRGPGTYRIYLRVMNGNGMWSDGGTDDTWDPDKCFFRDLVVCESHKLSNFMVTRIKELKLKDYYYDSATGTYYSRPINVDGMAIDYRNFPGIIDGLTKGYLFEFSIDSTNFNEEADTILITPHFYTCTDAYRDTEERYLYWENSYHEILTAGEGGHSPWALIELTKDDRTITGENSATWKGAYLIPGTAWAVPMGTPPDKAKEKRINRDIIVNFEIKGYKDGELKYDYNLQQWPEERTNEKYPYEIGDVIRYSHTKSNLDDLDVIINRP